MAGSHVNENALYSLYAESKTFFYVKFISAFVSLTNFLLCFISKRATVNCLVERVDNKR